MTIRQIVKLPTRPERVAALAARFRATRPKQWHALQRKCRRVFVGVAHAESLVTDALVAAGQPDVDPWDVWWFTRPSGAGRDTRATTGPHGWCYVPVSRNLRVTWRTSW